MIARTTLKIINLRFLWFVIDNIKLPQNRVLPGNLTTAVLPFGA